MRVSLGLLLLAGSASAGPPDPQALADRIDAHLDARLLSRGVPPAPPADDAEFHRRASLDLTGRIPTAHDVYAFLANPAPDKRAALIDDLTATPRHAQHAAALWRAVLVPETTAIPEARAFRAGFEAWLRHQFRKNTPYDALVRELLTVPLSTDPNNPTPALRKPDAPNPLAFYAVKEAKPENLAAATTRVFLGVQIECAQCHDHPFSRWTRDQFWGLAAFFAGVEQPQAGGGLREVLDRRELAIPGAERTVPATFLDDKEPEWQFRKSPRVTLAGWVTAKGNPFFARATVNRLWGFVFGVGIVDPIDDFHDQNEPSHPELLDALAKAFVESGYDTRYILRAIVLSETFQRSSATTDPGQQDVRLYARFPVQGMTPEQLFDSLTVVTGVRNPGAVRQQFLEAFALSGRTTEAPTTIIQALTLMNGGLVGGATTVESSRTLAAVVELPGLTAAERIEALYLAALGRMPRPEELRRAGSHVEAGDTGTEKQRYADVLWALLNGVEFRTNH